MSVKATFDASAADYDATRRKLIPCFDDFYGTAVEVLPFAPDDAPRVLDLGAGTGLLSALLLARLPRARLTLLDFSEPMLQQARQRFAGTDAAVAFVVRDYAEAALPTGFDAVVSALSIHHLSHEAKQRLFRKIYDALRPGGLFVNADLVLGPTPELDARNEAWWWSRVVASGLSDEELAAARERTKLDRLAPLDDQLAWLHVAGFVQRHLPYKCFRFAVYTGQRPNT